jgi:CubicO group peptidase (beta-lactamase class C family)
MGGQPAEVNDAVNIGSVTKYFTADLIQLLIAEGKLKPSTRVNDVLREATGVPAFNATLLQVMQHKGGFPRDHIPWLKDPNDPASRTEWRRLQVSTLSNREAFDPRGYAAPDLGTNPGGAESYSNLGYSILGTVAERVVGKPLEAVFKERIFDPFGIKSAGFGLLNPGGKDGSKVLGHFGYESDGVWKRYVNWQDNAEPRSMVATTGGGMHMSILDLCRYVTWRCMGSQVPKAPYPQTVMSTLWRDSEVIDSGSGARGGYRSWYRMDRNRQIAVVFVANANLTSAQAKEIEDYLSNL